MSEFEEVADEATLAGPSDEDLASIAEYARQQLELEDTIVQLEGLLEAAQRSFILISQFQLPEAMKAAGCEKYTLTGGAEIDVSPIVKGHISEAHKPGAYDWLRSNGHGSIIKNEIKTAFDKSKDNEAAELEEFLQEHGWDFDRKESIHGNTLNAFCKEEIKNGSDIPHALFGIFIGAKAKITRPFD